MRESNVNYIIEAQNCNMRLLTYWVLFLVHRSGSAHGFIKKEMMALLLLLIVSAQRVLLCGHHHLQNSKEEGKKRNKRKWIVLKVCANTCSSCGDSVSFFFQNKIPPIL